MPASNPGAWFLDALQVRARPAKRLGRAFGGVASALIGVTAGCREGGPHTAARGADTPALLRVISESQRDFRPRPATADDRRSARERQVSVRPRGAGRAARAAEPSELAIDSSAGLVAGPLAPPAGPVRTIRITPAAVTLRVGETVTLTLEALDSAGRRTHVPTARWRPDDTDVVRLDRTGRVTATAPGVAMIDAWVETVRASARVDVLPVVRGRLLTLDGGTPTGMHVQFIAPGFADTAVVGADGRFEFRPPATFAGPAELWIRPIDPGSAGYHPMVARLTARETGPELRAVVVPTTWTIRSGTYAGTTLPVSAEAALRRWRGVAPFARSAAYEGRRTQRVVGWAPHAFPLPVAFIRDPATAKISAADSVAFWASVHRFEEQLGFDAFRPADTTAVGEGRLGVEVVIDPRIPPTAVTWASWGPSGDLNDARVAVRAAADFRDAPLVAHEMLHALGFGHALEWRSVMTRTASADVKALTAEDVAYVQLIHRVRAAQAAFGAEIGFLEAADGERRVRR